MYKFGSLKQAEWQMMYDLAKMFLYCFNHWKLETPSVHALSSSSDDLRLYKENYMRYLLSCLVYLTAGNTGENELGGLFAKWGSFNNCEN